MNRIKELREKRGIGQKALASDIQVSQPTVSDWEIGRKIPSSKSAARLADYFGVSMDYLLGRDLVENKVDFIQEDDLVSFPVIGVISAGYDKEAIEEYTGERIPLPVSMLKGHPASDYFVLTVRGNSMYPKFLNGDKVLVLRTVSVDSGSIAVIMYDQEDATLKQVNYVCGEDWFDLVPINPEYQTKRVEGRALEQCRVLGKVVKLIRDV